MKKKFLSILLTLSIVLTMTSSMLATAVDNPLQAPPNPIVTTAAVIDRDETDATDDVDTTVPPEDTITATPAAIAANAAAPAGVPAQSSPVSGGDYPIIEGTYPIVDSHLHYQNFLQGSEGFPKLATEMVKANVPGAVIFGMPMIKMWDEHAPKQPAYYMSDDSRAYYYSGTDFIVAEALKSFRQSTDPNKDKVKFYPFVCGVNANDLNAAAQIEQLLTLYPNTFYGIGEVMLRHDDLTALTYGEAPRPNSPAMEKIFYLAGKKGIPVLIHHNISASYSKESLYLDELKEGLKIAEANKANVIWAHVGVSRRIEVESAKLIKITKDLLRDFPNLYVDISWLVFDNYIASDPHAWASLICENPDRFMIGSDKVGSWAEYGKEITKYHEFLNTIMEESIIKKLCYENILKLIHVVPDAPKEVTKSLEVAPVNATDVITKDDVKDVKKDIATDTTAGIPDADVTDVPKDIEKDVTEDTTKDIEKDTTKDTTKDTVKSPNQDTLKI